MTESGPRRRHRLFGRLGGPTALCILAACGSIVLADPGEGEPQRLRIAETFSRQLAAGEYAAAVKPFDETMSRVLPAQKLEVIWTQLEQQAGRFRSFGDPRASKAAAFDVVYVPAKFEKASFDLQIVFDADNRIAGFYIKPAGAEQQETAEYKRPPYDRPGRYTEQDVEFGDPGWKLKGKLTLPKTKKPAPAVVLVHGSGPHDADETIGSNKPFRDLAGGLSSKGIAVLRYEKRTFAHRLKLAARGTITVREEVIDDALAALAFVRGESAIDSSRVFLLGHSMGATLAPHVAEEDGRLAGVILLAAAARDVFDVLEEQLSYIASLPGPKQAANQKLHEEIRRAIGDYRAGRSGEDTPVLGVPISYWNDINKLEVSSPQAARRLHCRLLILGGGRDYQVTRADFDLYKKALEGRKNAAFAWQNDMNHLFIRGEGKATPDEYARPGNVDPEVVKKIALWISKNS